MCNSWGALVLAAGFGTRLQPLTLKMPKCLVEVNGIPMLERALKSLEAAKIRQVVVNTHYLCEQVEGYLQQRQSGGFTLQIAREQSLLGTGGPVKKAFSLMPDINQLLVINADIITDYPLTSLISGTRKGEGLFAVRSVSAASYLLADNDAIFSGLEIPDGSRTLYRPASTVSSWHYLGMHTVPVTISAYFKDSPEAASLWQVYEPAVRDGFIFRVQEVRENYYWNDVGSPESLEAARNYFSSGK